MGRPIRARAVSVSRDGLSGGGASSEGDDGLRVGGGAGCGSSGLSLLLTVFSAKHKTIASHTGKYAVMFLPLLVSVNERKENTDAIVNNVRPYRK